MHCVIGSVPACVACGAKFKNFTIHKFYCFGTPEDLAATLRELDQAKS
jgi:hypothetical protein